MILNTRTFSLGFEKTKVSMIIRHDLFARVVGIMTMYPECIGCNNPAPAMEQRVHLYGVCVDMITYMVFECRQCGICCMCMGDYIEIDRQVGQFEFLGSSVSTGTPFLARVDSDKQEIFSDRTWSEMHPSACPFLRPLKDRFVCTIHDTSPVQCKAYRCVVTRIRSPDGVEIGHVTGTLALHTRDPELRDAWRELEHVIDADPVAAEPRIAYLLTLKGYRCE